MHQLAASSFDGLMHCTPELLYAYAKYLWVCGAQPAACLAALRAHGGNIDLAAGTLLSADGAP